MLSNDDSTKTSINVQSPFKKVTNYSNSIPKLNFYNDSKSILNPNLSSLFQEKYINSPFHFGLNFYFGLPKNYYYQPQIYSSNIKPQENSYNYNNNPENMPTNIMFKNSLAKSGYRLTQEQIIQFHNNYIKQNNMNNNNNNNYYNTFSYCPINNNNNIINNIYPTYNKITNVQIIQDNESSKVNENSQEKKKENISNNSIKKEKDIKITKKEENINNNNINKKIIFECSETKGINININKNLLKKKRLRKNNEQLVLLTKFYEENKNWSKEKIKEISEVVGLKENKIYKWLWDQKNKEFKATKFIVKK